MSRVLIRVAIPLLFFVLGVALVRLGSPPRIDITWETASEVDTAGFLLYRSESPDGPFSLLTETPIPARGDPLVGASYHHEDRGVAWGQRYFYQLEEVERSGIRNPFPQVVEGRADIGWLWALAGGTLLAILGGVAVTDWRKPETGGRQPAGSGQ